MNDRSTKCLLDSKSLPAHLEFVVSSLLLHPPSSVNMERKRAKNGTANSNTKAQQLDRFTPLLADIRNKLSDHWTLYEECIDGVLDAAANHQDTTAWMEQMEQLVERNDKITFSHQGILFLLHDMGIPPSKQQNWGEGEKHTLGMYSSPPLSSQESQGPGPSLINNMGTLSVYPRTTMSSLLPHRPLHPHAPATTAPRTQPFRTQQQQRQQPQQPPDIQNGVLPFDFSTSVQPSLTFLKDLKAFHYPPEQVNMTGQSPPPPPNPLRNPSSNPVFFTDSTLREDVAEMFGHALQVKNSAGNVDRDSQQARQKLPYDPKDDDLMLWTQQLKGGGDDQAWGSEVKANGFVSDVWPPWDFRFDLDP